MIALLFAGAQAKAQTAGLPQPFDLSTGNYRWTGWDSSSTAGTYPANMIFHGFTNTPAKPWAVATKNWDCAYNLTSRSRIRGLGANGFSFVNTSTAQTACNPAIPGDIYVGAAVIAVNATGRENINVTATVGLVAQGDGNGTPADARGYRVQMQYRAEPGDTFTTAPGSAYEYSSVGGVNGDSLVLTSTLPAACNNKPNAQVRFIYYADGTGAGTRPQIRLNNVKVTSDLTAGTGRRANGADFSISPNPGTGEATLGGLGKGTKTITVFDMLGNRIEQLRTAASEYQLRLDEPKPGIYMVQVQGSGNSSTVRRMVVR